MNRRAAVMLDDNIRASGLRLGFLALCIIGAVGVLLSRLWNVQVVNTDVARQRSEQQTTVKTRIAPARGTICDRNGLPLAENRPSFDIDFYLDTMRRDYAQTHKGRTPMIPADDKDDAEAAEKMLHELGDKGDATQKTAVSDAIHKLREAMSRGDAEDIRNDVNALNREAETLSSDLYKREIAEGRKHTPEIDIVEIVKDSIQPISQTLGLTAELNEKEIVEHYRTDRDLPYHYMTDLDFATVAQFEERNSGVAGIRIAQNPARVYTYGALAAHILGYVGKPDNQNEHLSSDGVTPYETIGRHGIEATMDDHLQGQPGSAIWRVSSQGYYIGDKPIAADDPTMGNSVYLTIDARVQYIAETAMRNSGWTRGSVIVMDPRNGDVLALASFPDYDPNTFIPRISTKNWDKLNNDDTTPLFNRALHTFQPGSTYKIMVALAGLKSGRVTAGTDFDCPSAIQIDDHLFHNSDYAPGGTMSLINAIKVSSDVFFYQYGIRAGIDAIDAMGARVGFGQKWGLLGDDDEDAGILPGPGWMKDNEAWLRKTHNIDHWSNAQTANTSIGQGFVQITPLQLATFLCAVANGGTVYKPRLYSKVIDYKGEVQAEPPPGQIFNTLGVTPTQLQDVQEGMREVVESAGGTGNAGQVPGYVLAGKTGTAQAYRRVGGERKQDLKTWFYCYGPFEKPRYVTCVLVEGGTWGGRDAAPIAAEVMRRLFAMDAGGVENVASLTPLEGNFKGVTDPEVHTDPGSKSPDSDDNSDSPTGDMPSPPPAASARSSSTSPAGGTKRAH